MSSTSLWSDVCDFQQSSSEDDDGFALTIDENTIPKSPLVLRSHDDDAKLLQQLLTHSQNHEHCLE